MARRMGQSISRTVALVGCSRSAVVSVYQKSSKEGTVVNWQPGQLLLRLTDVHGERRLAQVVKSNRRAHVISDWKVSEYTVHHSLLCMGQQSSRAVRVPMLTPVHCRKHQQWKHEHQNWTMEQWKSVVWSDESRFLLHHVDGRVRRLPGEHIVPGCTMGRRQAGGGSVMLWAMFCWETLGPAIHVDVTLTRTTHLSIVADHVHPFMEMVPWWSVSRILRCATKQIWLSNGLSSTTTTLRCWLVLQIPQISVQSNICGMCLTKSNPWTESSPTSQFTAVVPNLWLVLAFNYMEIKLYNKVHKHLKCVPFSSLLHKLLGNIL